MIFEVGCCVRVRSSRLVSGERGKLKFGRKPGRKQGPARKVSYEDMWNPYFSIVILPIVLPDIQAYYGNSKSIHHIHSLVISLSLSPKSPLHPVSALSLTFKPQRPDRPPMHAEVDLLKAHRETQHLRHQLPPHGQISPPRKTRHSLPFQLGVLCLPLAPPSSDAGFDCANKGCPSHDVHLSRPAQ